MRKSTAALWAPPDPDDLRDCTTTLVRSSIGSVVGAPGITSPSSSSPNVIRTGFCSFARRAASFFAALASRANSASCSSCSPSAAWSSASESPPAGTGAGFAASRRLRFLLRVARVRGEGCQCGFGSEGEAGTTGTAAAYCSLELLRARAGRGAERTSRRLHVARLLPSASEPPSAAPPCCSLPPELHHPPNAPLASAAFSSPSRLSKQNKSKTKQTLRFFVTFSERVILVVITMLFRGPGQCFSERYNHHASPSDPNPHWHPSPFQIGIITVLQNKTFFFVPTSRKVLVLVGAFPCAVHPCNAARLCRPVYV